MLKPLQTSLKFAETSDIPQDVSSWANNSNRASKGITWRRWCCQGSGQNVFEKSNGVFFWNRIYSGNTGRIKKQKLWSILSCMINTDFSWTLIIYIRWSSIQKRLADPKRIKICLNGPRALCNFSCLSSLTMFCQIFDVKMLEDPTVCLGLRGLQMQRQEGMLSGFGTLIPSAPTPTRYRGKGDVFSSSWWSRGTCTNK